MDITKGRKRRSVALRSEELKAFKKWYSQCHTKTDAEEESGVPRQILDNISFKGSASPGNIEKIRTLLTHVSAA